MNHLAYALTALGLIAAIVALVLNDSPWWAFLLFLTLCVLKVDR